MKYIVATMAAVIVLVLSSMSHVRAQQPDQCPAYLELAKGMIAERDMTIEIQGRAIKQLQAKVAELTPKEKKDGAPVHSEP